MSDQPRPIFDIEGFYRSGKVDMTLRREAMKYARENPDKYKRASYYVADRIEESNYRRRNVFLWRYLDASLGGRDKWRPQHQRRGTCVGQGAKLGCDDLLAINHRFGGGRWVGRSSVAAAYAGSRVDIGKQPGRWDGSTGFWVVQWLIKFGIVTLDELGLADDSLTEDENLAVQWAASRDGVPREYEILAREKPIVDTYVCETPDEAAVALDSGSLLLICSNLIASGRRDRYGVSPLQNAGGHCQLVRAKFYDENGRRLWTEQNSWGKWGSGPKFPDDMPDGAVNLDDQSLARQLRSGDCHIITGVRGLEPLADRDLIHL